MINLLKRLLNYIYKDKCYFCSSSKENSIFCTKCFEDVDFLTFNPLENIGNSKLYSCFYYKKTIQKLIRAVKYHNQKDLACFQATLMFNYWKNIETKKDKYLVIPVPLHKKRLKKRKYNHMDLVGNEFCKLTGYEFCDSLIERIKETTPQYKLSKKEREKNLKDAFKYISKEKPTLPILLIDDITTTGSTLLEIIKELNKNDIFDITAFTTAIPENNSFYVY